MKKRTSEALPEKQNAEIEALAALPDDEIDTSDLPEILDWSRARRGPLYRPVKRGRFVPSARLHGVGEGEGEPGEQDEQGEPEDVGDPERGDAAEDGAG